MWSPAMIVPLPPNSPCRGSCETARLTWTCVGSTWDAGCSPGRLVPGGTAIVLPLFGKKYVVEIAGPASEIASSTKFHSESDRFPILCPHVIPGGQLSCALTSQIAITKSVKANRRGRIIKQTDLMPR